MSSVVLFVLERCSKLNLLCLSLNPINEEMVGFIFFFFFSFLLIGLEAYRNKHDALNYVASGSKFRLFILNTLSRCILFCMQ